MDTGVCQATDEAKKQRDTEELGDAMKALENRTLDSKQEMDILAALDEMKSMRVSSFFIQVATHAFQRVLVRVFQPN
jgi:hypothetical protein